MGIVADVQVLLNDSGVFWPAQTVLDAVNEAQFWVFADTKFTLTSSSLVLTSGTDVVAIPSTILIPKWVEGTGTGTVMERINVTTQRSLEQHCRTWMGDALAAPTHVVIWDATHLRVFPKPDTTYTYTLFGTGFPSEITSNQSVSGPTSVDKAVQCYTLALLFEATRPDLGDMYMRQAEEYLLAIKKRLRNQQSHNIRTLVPATKRSQIRLGGTLDTSRVYWEY